MEGFLGDITEGNFDSALVGLGYNPASQNRHGNESFSPVYVACTGPYHVEVFRSTFPSSPSRLENMSVVVLAECHLINKSPASKECLQGYLQRVLTKN